MWAETCEVYPALGGEPTEHRLKWKFRSGATISLSHLNLERDWKNWSGAGVATFAFDEAQFFTRKQFEMMLSCLRTTCGVKTRFLLTFNPDETSWLIDYVRPYLDINDYPIQAMSGVIRYFGRTSRGAFGTYASLEEAKESGCDAATSYTFIPALIFDNKILLAKDPGYLTSLKSLPPGDREQLLMGCWRAKRRAGEMIQASWFPVLQHGILARRTAGQPDDRDVIRWCLCADLAGSPRDGDMVKSCEVPRYAESTGNPDWTRIFLLGQFRDGRVVIWQGWSARDVPGAIEFYIKRILETECPRGTVVVMSQDPGQAGKHQIESYSRALRGLARVETTQPLNLIYSANYLARVAFSGLLMLRDPDVSQSWQPALIRELEGYSSDGHSATGHDDQVSALSTGLIYLATKSHPRVMGALPSLDGPMSGENQIRTKPHWKALHPEREFGHDFR